jgi:hypothetical protein
VTLRLLLTLGAAVVAAGPATAQSLAEWRPVTGFPEQLALWQGGRQLGTYDRGAGRYWPLLDATARQFGSPGEPPVSPPAGWDAPPPQNFGLDLARLSEPAGEEFIVNGRAVSRQEAFAAVADGRLSDDSQKLRLTLIGPTEECARVRQDLERHPALTAQKEALVVQDYRPDDPLLAGLGFVTSGAPTIYLQKPDGRVLFRLHSYPGPEVLAGAIRQRRPDYDPSKDDDPTKPPPAPAPAPAPASDSTPPGPAWAWAAGTVFLILLLTKGGRRAAAA